MSLYVSVYFETEERPNIKGGQAGFGLRAAIWETPALVLLS